MNIKRVLNAFCIDSAVDSAAVLFWRKRLMILIEYGDLNITLQTYFDLMFEL